MTTSKAGPFTMVHDRTRTQGYTVWLDDEVLCFGSTREEALSRALSLMEDADDVNFIGSR